MYELRPYQEKGADALYANDKIAVLAAVGAGKTAMALTAMWDMIRDGHAKRWLVLAPKRVATEVWPVERTKWAWGLRMAVAVGSPAHRLEALMGDHDIVVATYDNIQTLTKEALAGFDGVVFDELTKMKNPSGKRFKALAKMIDIIPIHWGLTGSFTTNGLEDAYGQCRILGEEILGPYKTHFLNEYFICTNRDFDQWVPKESSFQRVMDRIKPYTFLLENEEYKDKLPPLHIVPVEIKADLSVYRKMKHDWKLELDGVEVAAMSAGSLTNKLQQCASGWVYDTKRVPVEVNGMVKLKTVSTPHWFSGHKFDRLEEILEENQHAPTLVFYNYVEELEELKRRFPQLQTLDSPNAVDRFNEGKIEILAAHPKSASHGLNLQGTAHHMVFISLPWSLDTYEQAIGRLHRGGQKNEVWVYILRTKGTIDYRLAEVLEEKRVLSETCTDALRGTVDKAALLEDELRDE
jgi:SNF2 family DNA or RNA helicase